jgi:hypothetical protein
MKSEAFRRYRYVGPEHLKRLVSSPSKSIITPDELQDVLKSLSIGPGTEERTATYIIDLQGVLRLAHRRSEHVSCAGGADVLSAGEISFDCTQEKTVVEWVTNQSTGYCPEPESWSVVEQALRRLNVVTPDEFSLAVVFRRCEECGQINIVKDAYFECDVCSSQLPRKWNFN